MSFRLPQYPPACRSLGRGQWITVEEWEFEAFGIRTCIPSGFVSDLYSAPLGILVRRDQPDNRYAFGHDWLYATIGLRLDTDNEELSREECDLILVRAGRLIYHPVRWFGWGPWSRLAKAGHSIANPMMT